MHKNEGNKNISKEVVHVYRKSESDGNRVMTRIWATYRPTYETQQFSVFMLRHLHKIYNYNQDSQFFYIVWI